MSCSVTSCSRREVCHTNVCSSVFVLSQPRFEVTDIKGPLVCHSSRVLDRLCYSSQVSNGPCYSSQINQCYSSILFRRQQENPSLRHESTSIQRPKEKSTPETERERERERAPFGSSFYVFFFPLGLPYASWAQSGVLFYLQSSLWSSDLPLTYLCSVLWGFPLPCLLATTILDSFPLVYLPQEMGGTILREQGHRGLSGYFLLNWDSEGYWASLSCQSQASESSQRCPSKGV